MKKRWRYYIDRDFQNKFIFRFSFIMLLNATLTLGILWLVKEKSYNLLPENASVLVQIDVDKALPISFSEEKPFIDVDNGKNYFPLKMIDGKSPRLFNAFDLYIIPIIGTSFLNIILVSLFSIFFSHKMAGPIRRIKNTLDDYSNKKNVGPIKLRKGDFFQDLAESINKAIFRKSNKE